MFNPRFGFRPVIAFPAEVLGCWGIIIFGTLFAIYLLLTSAWIFALIFLLGFSPIWLWIPLGFLLGWGLANRPARTSVALAIGLALVAIILWKLAIGPQFAHSADAQSTFRRYTLPIILLGVPCFGAWLAAVTALHVRTRPRLAAWWAVTGIAIVGSLGTIWLIKPYSVPLINRYIAADRAAQQQRVADDKLCDRANLRSDIHDQRIYAVCAADHHLPPVNGRHGYLDWNVFPVQPTIPKQQ